MSYRKVYFRIQTENYASGWSSDADRAAFKEESRRLFQELGWSLVPGGSGICDTVTKDRQDLYLHPTSFSRVLDEANIQPLQAYLSKAQTFQCYAYDCYEEYQDLSDEAYHAALEAKRGEITDFILEQCRTKPVTSTLQRLSLSELRSSLKSAVCATGTDTIRSGINSQLS